MQDSAYPAALVVVLVVVFALASQEERMDAAGKLATNSSNATAAGSSMPLLF